MLTQQVEDSLRAAQEHLRDALAFAARGEKPYVAKHIANFLADIDNLVDAQDLIENMREYMDDKIREREDGSSD
tara:strand:+ start:276 stop:497 length:222 start_codon:yes stop_codon:yes gene_type:complete